MFPKRSFTLNMVKSEVVKYVTGLELVVLNHFICLWRFYSLLGSSLSLCSSL
jgi:hypothetical protein